MKNLILYTSLMASSAAMAGGSWGGGTPPAMNTEELLSKIPSDSLIKTSGGKILIPLTPESIRRLNIRTSTGIETSIKTDTGEVFMLRKDADRLIDKMKAAEVIENLKMNDAAIGR